ncbi:bifunctional [glutamate--ammonia ligase]-adenylyl-L-tyrosine phosphorylase/[glutamate--ammonia-ligase] adenylyltransferase [Larsenimonas rhizosphaerae]|uniref:bifunctional [glutamate--ammonia ligase]-adenylyl-L-tyrosine phosphorylase/[glutamate--ammonia-ligase] adenylyltransferase n=1 Tax=Larsenimonas rhizosphaerae TaxID=2944682 RepID=UPI00203496B6|nr:bifunctional [glutamate--ammonia ligase]-adenylyl-L-tyrosine phosphorylase/[glutamate--ammonia-ligase] adenylyltransferase [Larsenimonas rhizosphaerae]MCM2129806.1 bifunctional [glutamate--ammonia ligase]-adenylyl-L-tyrosine phosphorylase/[glutamate--ammonia-ligase] adenylyltransferase [Larsenimonas rhizosphaerae]
MSDAELQARLEQDVDAVMDALPSEIDAWLPRTQRTALKQVAVLSPWVADHIRREPDLLRVLGETGEWEAPLSRDAMTARLSDALEQASDEPGLHRVLRRFRRERQIGIIWRDLAGEAGAWATGEAMTTLAEVCLEQALTWLEQLCVPRWGRPQADESGERPRLVVLGMGKFGAGELNLSSDIDLIFAFEHRGTTEGGRRQLDHQEYFTRMGQKLIAALDQVTADGFVFRVDMRLRPLGEGGPLVNPFSTTASYYQDQGREWERYALLKARPVAGDLAAGERLLMMLKPFVYRRYIDFGAIASLREMKALINREVRRRNIGDNIKLGRGGIREVEFIVQAFQLIRGGRDTRLQTPSLHDALSQLAALELLPEAVMTELTRDYVFLRNAEHALQAQQDKQTQTLPEDDLARLRLARAMKCPDWRAFLAALDEVRTRVRHHFDAVVAAPDDEEHEHEDSDIPLDQWRALWEESLEEEEARSLLLRSGFEDPANGVHRLNRLRRSRAVINMQRVAFERLDAMMPALLAQVAATDAPSSTLERVLPLVESVLRRTAYLSLLRENPDALNHFVRLCAASPWIAEQIARHPMLLDEMLSPALLTSRPSRTSLEHELRQSLARIPAEDEEALLEALRHFRHARVLHVAAGDVAGVHGIMNVSDSLTDIAEVVLEAVIQMAWRSLIQKHGVPTGHEGGPRFAVIGYGKLGGIELGYGSDLDLVFLFEPSLRPETPGPRVIDSPVFFTRLGQRIIHLLTAITPAGALYEVDMRLRPSGNSGLLVSTFDAFAEYQRQQAWTWEHQALVRARPVAGHRELFERFDGLRREILSTSRDLPALRRSVVEMRHKMRTHLAGSSKDQAEGRFHLKQDPGGLVDIEFLNQYAVLALSHESEALLTYTDNIRLIETLESCGQISQEEAAILRDAYLAYRAETHRQALSKAGEMTSSEGFDEHRRAVARLWQRWMEPDNV